MGLKLWLEQFGILIPSPRDVSILDEQRGLDRLFPRIETDDDDLLPGDDSNLPIDILSPETIAIGGDPQDIVMGDPQPFSFPTAFAWYEILPENRRYKLAIQNLSGAARMFFRRFRGPAIDPAADLALIGPGFELGPGQLWGDLFPGHVGSVWALTNAIPSTLVYTEWTRRT